MRDRGFPVDPIAADVLYALAGRAGTLADNLGIQSLHHRLCAALAALSLCVLATAARPNEIVPDDGTLATKIVEDAPPAALELFLDHLMRAESSGRDDAANPRSTAVGAFQFIKSTFVTVARQFLAEDVAKLTDEEILALRSNRDFARRAASAYCKANAAYLGEQGIRANFGHLRLAFLVGAGGAAKLLKSPPLKPVTEILSDAAVRANPFMKDMTAADLIARARNDIEPRRTVASADGEAGSDVSVRGPAPRCSRALTRCRHLAASHGRKQARRSAPADRKKA
jgi:hypothetical protein